MEILWRLKINCYWSNGYFAVLCHFLRNAARTHQPYICPAMDIYTFDLGMKEIQLIHKVPLECLFYTYINSV